MIKSLLKHLFLLAVCLNLISSCSNKTNKNDLIIFHAGSLSVPFKQIATAFKKEHPEVNVILEAAGSRSCARKIADLNRPCDIMASADYKVIDNLLIPEHASKNYKFATNQMVIAYTEKSEQAKFINSQNWINILLSSEVAYGRSDPNSDPCGYRTVLVSKLASLYYNRPGMADSLLIKDNKHIRPKEVDLLALLETQIIDYVFIYKSVAHQHQLKYIELPDSVNLGNKTLNSYYKQATVWVSGKTPKDSILFYGEPMVYGITQLKNNPNPEVAKAFMTFFFDKEKGMKIIKENGQNTNL